MQYTRGCVDLLLTDLILKGVYVLFLFGGGEYTFPFKVYGDYYTRLEDT